MGTRRGFLRTMAGVATVGLAGCSLLSGPVEESADPAGVREDAYVQEGFEHRKTEEIKLEETVEVGGESRDLRLTSYLVEYGKDIAEIGPQGAQYMLFTTPSITLAETEANPLGNLADKQLLASVVGRSDQSASAPEKTRTKRLSVLDSEVPFKIYEANATAGGQSVPIITHFGRLKHDGDLLSMVGIYPSALDESSSIVTLTEGTYHPAEF